MRLAVTDACIFIDLYLLGIIERFFELDIEVHTTYDVLNELYEHQRKPLFRYQRSGKLTVHLLTHADRIRLYDFSCPRSLSETDKTVIYLALRIEALLLSSDKAVRRFAKQQSIEYHGMIWILDQLLEKELLTPLEASGKLTSLVAGNFLYQNNAELMLEVYKRLKKWK